MSFFNVYYESDKLINKLNRLKKDKLINNIQTMEEYNNLKGIRENVIADMKSFGWKFAYLFQDEIKTKGKNAERFNQKNMHYTNAIFEAKSAIVTLSTKIEWPRKFTQEDLNEMKNYLDNEEKKIKYIQMGVTGLVSKKEIIFESKEDSRLNIDDNVPEDVNEMFSDDEILTQEIIDESDKLREKIWYIRKAQTDLDEEIQYLASIDNLLTTDKKQGYINFVAHIISAQIENWKRYKVKVRAAGKKPAAAKPVAAKPAETKPTEVEIENESGQFAFSESDINNLLKNVKKLLESKNENLFSENNKRHLAIMEQDLEALLLHKSINNIRGGILKDIIQDENDYYYRASGVLADIQREISWGEKLPIDFQPESLAEKLFNKICEIEDTLIENESLIKENCIGEMLTYFKDKVFKVSYERMCKEYKDVYNATSADSKKAPSELRKEILKKIKDIDKVNAKQLNFYFQIYEKMQADIKELNIINNISDKNKRQQEINKFIKEIEPKYQEMKQEIQNTRGIHANKNFKIKRSNDSLKDLDYTPDGSYSTPVETRDKRRKLSSGYHKVGAFLLMNK